MNYSDIIALARAGFTAQQIAQMSQAEQVPQEHAPAPATQETTPAPATQETTPAPATQETTPAPDQLTAILAEMQTLKQTMQALNRQNAELIPPTPQSAQDILSSIIAPPKKNGEK